MNSQAEPTTTYEPVPGTFVGRPPCAHCGAAYRLHQYQGPDRPLLGCPTAYRPADLVGALRQLQVAKTPDQVFAARGEVQRHLGHRPGTCLPLCEACEALLRSWS